MRHINRGISRALVPLVWLIDSVLDSSERDGAVLPGSYALWVLLNALCLGGLLFYLPHQWTGYAASAFFLTHAAIIYAAIPVVSQRSILPTR